MARDETGMNVVLIDTAKRLEELHRVYPGLAKRFECIGTSDSIKAKKAEKVKKPVEKQPEKQPVKAATPLKEVKPAAKPAVKATGEVKKTQPAERPAVKAAVQPEKKQQEKKQPVKQQPVKRPVQAPVVKDPKRSSAEPKEAEMDIDEFAKYACQYAGKIDCSISGKSMLALYERIEIMEEDGIALTKEEAENLIEEAADRAENPSFFKKITGIFSSKYDRDGLLILKEEHFL